MKKFYSIFLILSLLFLTSCASGKGNDTLNVVTTSNPNYNLVKYIAQDKVNLYPLKFNSSTHDFDAKSEDIKAIEDSDVIFYNGLGLDDKILDFSKNNKFVNTTEGVTLIELEHSHDDVHEESNYDPHVWLSLKEYKIMAKNVLDKLVELDINNKDFYNKNYEDFISRADSIYETYKEDFDKLSNRKFISNHASYGYLSRDFNLVNNSLYDINNHGELNPQSIQTIIDIVRQENIKLIIGDEFESNKELETIYNETGVNYKIVNNLESIGDYFTEYEKLLSSIYDGLK